MYRERERERERFSYQAANPSPPHRAQHHHGARQADREPDGLG